MLGGQMAGGGVGVAVPEELVLIHCILEMGISADSSSLRRFAPLFVEAVEKWRAKAKDIVEGRESTVSTKEAPKSQMPPMPGRPNTPFMKI